VNAALTLSRRAWLGGLLAALAQPGRARPPWPVRPIRLVVAYPPGGVSDDIARALAQQVSAGLGVPMVVEHRSGAGGTLAMEALAKAPADGYTLVLSAITPLTLSPHLGRVGYRPLHDIAPVVSVMATPALVVGTPAFAGTSLADALVQAQRAPGALRWASSGVGTTGHLMMARIAAASGVDITHVPYKGGGTQLNDALGGHFELLSTNVGLLQLRYIREGRFKPLAVGAPERLPVLPEVPTLGELGFGSANRMSVFGIFAPAGTAPDVLERLNIAFNEALQWPEVQARLRAVNNLPTGGTREAFARVIEEEFRANQALPRQAEDQRP
jgi:tripartite-type tricarboxylate transporter receptor subunit TctC